jgi:hypothetical protein
VAGAALPPVPVVAALVAAVVARLLPRPPCRSAAATDRAVLQNPARRPVDPAVGFFVPTLSHSGFAQISLNK